MSITFRPGVRENVGLWINLVGGTGSGKTKTGMRLATGICGLDTPFAVIDTENGRALHYAPKNGEKADGIETYNFSHANLRPPFRPDTYADAVVEADKAGFPVIMIDNGSHVWSGDGGMLDWQDDELDEMVKRAAQRGDRRQEWQIREAGKMSAWIKPKKAHKQMVEKLLQVKAHIIMCLRAEPKIEMVKDKDGKFVIQAKESLVGLNGWIPICDKNLPFEATVSFLLMADKPGFPNPIKLQSQHRALFPLDKPITEESGRLIAAWASGAKPKEPAPPESIAPSNGSAEPSATTQDGADPAAFVSADQAIELEDLTKEAGVSKEKVLRRAGVTSFGLFPIAKYLDVKKALKDRITERVKA